MKRFITTALLMLLAGLTACKEPSSEQGEQAQQPQSYVFTDYTDATELFVEFSALIVGQTSSFAAHFSNMRTFRPVERGVVTVILSGGGQPEERFSVDQAAVAGIFIPKAQPRYAGVRQLTLELQSDSLNARHALGAITVYPDLKTALANAGEESEDGNDITFLKEQQWKVDFATEVVTRQPLQPSVRALASIKAATGHEAWVSAPLNGHVLTEASGVPKVGGRVKKGQVLATLGARLSGSSDLAELEMSVQTARARYQLADSERQRLQKLFNEQAVAKRRLLEAESNAKVTRAELQAAQKRLRQTHQQAAGGTSGVKLYAPINGVLTAVNIAAGSYVEEGDALFQLIDPQTLWLETRVAEADSGRLGPPERVGFKVAGMEKSFTIKLGENGQLVAYGQLVDSVTRTLPLVFEFDNADLKLAAGLLAEARLYHGDSRLALAVPETALIDDNGQDVVFVHASGESFQRRVLRLGIRDQGYAEVLSGLNDGERVVTTGAYLVHLASSSTQPAAHGHAH
ncbi:efflux RND transporter periplasmic adaptor subunit [Methylomarinum sp. Ch1-1]|uniref:Efflux RND transporter periplasmic adaptor subunit n=1 Tax=Methylomarinum roseum TaxID=3067653 RepID=A0AAU7NTR7_9GAMM|nr:efflux RND transporter periplasmic adaptor subunit [Methylomarinum sp. Ch1-1]MDP4519520.1 efflux RND transporter periplasmic adaptor subunit [Methylomarinum sp. Ch1-1]